MCGITGILHFNPQRNIDSFVLRKMTDTLYHRGPDGEGYYVKQNVGLGHRRLSIIDLSTGDQPMYNEDKSIVLIFNGEIYNYIELRKILKNHGHKFLTNSDTEVIIKSYEEWGVDCQSRFNGMWAFALWDERKKQLFVSRDRLGEKPLNYCVYDNTFLFSSEIKGLLAYGVPPEPNTEVLELYLSLSYVPSPHTFYKNIKKLKPGHFLIIKDSQIKENKYWSLPILKENDYIKNERFVLREFDDLLKDSIQLRMRSDVPFGAFLSGGLDSSSIVSIMSKISTSSIETFTIGFQEKTYDERTLAKEVSEKFNTNHHEKVISPENLEVALKKILLHYDEPFADPAAIPTGYLSAYASKFTKMVLTGDGGDEVLCGYKAYKGEEFARLYQQLPNFLKKNLFLLSTTIAHLTNGSLRYNTNRISRILQFSDSTFEHRILNKYPLPSPYRIQDLIEKKGINAEEFLETILRDKGLSNSFYKLSYFNLTVSLPDQMLVKVDKMAMANSLETRIPFLDHRLVELMYSVDKKIKFPWFKTKHVLKAGIGKTLPSSLLSAPKKGFVVPLREWFKDKTFNRKLDDLYREDSGLNNHVIKKIVSDHRQGKGDFANIIWRLIVYQNWLKQITKSHNYTNIK